MLDLIVRGGTVVTPGGMGQWEVGVSGEHIAAVALPGSLPDEGARVIDATGKVVVPGGVEAHAHIGAQMVNAAPMDMSGPADVTRAALFGGTTTVVDFAILMPESDLFQALDERHGKWQGQSYIDYSYHVMLTHGASRAAIAQIKDVIKDGFATIKIFTTSVRPPIGAHTHHLDYGRLAVVMEEVSRAGGMLMVHSEDDEMVQWNYQNAKEDGQYDWSHMPDIHSNISEDISFRRVLNLAERKECALYMAHVSAKEGVDAIREARSRNHPVYGETLHNYLCFTAENYHEPDGMKYHTYPSLKSENDRLWLWQGLETGALSTVATDHISTPYAQKVRGKTVADVTGGHNGIETRMGIMYTEGVHRRSIPLTRFVEMTATNPAKILGLYPRKGVLAPGSDADICIIDPSFKRRLALSDLHLVDYSIWEGWPVEGWPVTTVLRGKVVVEDGVLSGQEGDGRLLPRKVDGGMLERVGC